VRFERSSKLFSFLQERADAPNYEDLTAQLYVPELQETGVVVMRDCVKAFKDFALLDFAMLCDFGLEQCADLFDCPTRLWLNTSVDAVRRNRVTIKEGYALFLELCEQACYRKDIVEHVTWKLDHKDENDPLSFLELDPEQRFPCMIHFIQNRKIIRNSKVKQLQTILKKSVETTQSGLGVILEKTQSALKAAKWYHFALAAVPFVAILWYMYQKPKDNHALNRIESMKQMTSEDVTHLMSGPIVELGSSADPKTATIKKSVIELGSSADPKTMNVKKATVEVDSLTAEYMLDENGKCCVCGSSTDPVLMLHGIKKLACLICFGKMMKMASPGSLNSLLLAPPTTTELQSSEPLQLKDKRLQAQLQLDPNAFAISKKVLNNIYEFQLEIEGKWSAKMKLCMIRGRVGLTVAHLIPYLKLASRVRLYNKNVPDGHIFPIGKISWEIVLDAAQRPKDQILVCFPSDLHDHADLTGSIADSVTMSSFGRCSAVLCVPFDGGALMKYGEIKAFDQNVISYFDGDRELTIRDRYEYTSLETTRGDCGSILIAIGSHLPKKILGIHVAGNVGLGVASPLAVKDILRTMNSFPIQAHISLDVDMYLMSQAAFDDIKKPDGNFVTVGVSKIQAASPSKTALRHSKCYGKIIEALTAPAALKPILVEGKLVDPMYNGLKKAGQIPPSLNDEYLDAAINDVMRIVCSNIRESDCRILSNLEAVAGVEGDDCLPPIKRSSSAGYPWIADRKGIGKTKWLGSDAYSLSPDVEFVMNERERLAKQGIRYPTFWIDTLKDERRPLDKVAIGKTRVFSAGPMDFTLSFRKYFLGFAAHCTRNRIDNEISVGTNVYSQDWTKTAKKCISKGSKVIAGDFSNFDGTLLLPILYRILDIVNEFYNDGEENALIRHVLWKEIINSIHVCGNNVYMWTHSQPSGCPITAILNSIFNSVSMRYCWMVVFQKEPIMQSMKMFNKHVAMVSYGDDNVVNISDDICEKFNQLTIAEAYATLGMVYTDEGKSGEMVKYRDIENVAYLKRKFVWSSDEMIWLAPLAMETVLEMTNWIRGDLNQEASTVENMETSAFELSIHGKKIFDEWIPKYVSASRTFAERPKFLTYNEYRHSEAVKYGRLNE
jgi:preprotein translocase subunit YajC